MLTIRSHQIAQLDLHFQERLIQAIRAHIKEHLPDEYVTYLAADEHNTAIRQSVDLGLRYELTTDASLTIFADFCLVYGPSFPQQQPWALAILTDDTLAEEEKTDQLQAHLDTYLNDDDDR